MGQLVFQATLGGQVNLVGPNTASTFNLNVPAVSSTIATLAAQTFTGTQTMTTLTSPAATNFTLQSAGTTAVTIDTSQNVGIGGTPVQKLSILPTSIRRMDFFVRNPGVDDSLVIRSQHATNNNIRDMILEGNNVKVFTGADTGGSGTESMRIDSSGNVGIGTTSPSAPLNVYTNSATTLNVDIKNAKASGQGDTYLNLYKAPNGNSNGVGFYTGTTQKWVVGTGITAIDDLFKIYNSSTGSAAVTIDSSGNVGIGTTSPTATGGYDKAIDLVGGSNGAGLYIRGATNPSTVFASIQYDNFSNRTNINATGTGNFLRFVTVDTERMRIDSSGNLLVGATSQVAAERLNVTGGNQTGIMVKNTGGNTYSPIYSWNATTTGDGYFAAFFTEASQTFRGSITYNRTAGLTAYNTTSDYRAKTVNGPVQNALSKVALLKPSTGRMNGATQDIDFFVAHELQEVVPSAVSGEKDAVNEDNTPKYQVVDKSAVIPLLTAAIQELKAINDTQAETINALTARVVALETK